MTQAILASLPTVALVAVARWPRHTNRLSARQIVRMTEAGQ